MVRVGVFGSDEGAALLRSSADENGDITLLDFISALLPILSFKSPQERSVYSCDVRPWRGTSNPHKPSAETVGICVVRLPNQGCL